MEAGDIVCLEGDISGRGVLASHFRDLTDTQFAQSYGVTKEQWFIENNVPAMVYIRPTTKKNGRTRSLISPDRGKNSQLAVFDDEIFGVGSYEFTALPERWCPIWSHTTQCPEGGGPLKPIQKGDTYLAWSPQRQEYLCVPTRWQRNLMFCRPYENPKWEDFEMELLPAAPGVNGANFRVNGGGSKTGRPKLGAGVRLFNAQAEPTFPECHDNKYLKHHQDQHPREAEEWYIPWGEFRPKFRWWSDQVTKGSLTINFPLTGIGKLVSGIERPSRGRVTTPRPQETDSDYYHPMQPRGQNYPPVPAKQRQTGNPFMNPARANPFSTSNTPANYYPQGSTNSPQGFVPPTQPSDAKTARQKIDELMKKLMSGESLTTEELMSLQRRD
mgnify:CR=1 FL=1|tara:strand:- start:4043 stop:5197 length:1155 start_codon:yes stop_codon:yes gene_type:complete